MNTNGFSALRPLSSLLPGEPTLTVDSSCTPDALYSNADVRLTAAISLLETAALAGGSSALDGHDVTNIAQAAKLLASDAQDLMSACQEAHVRQSAQHDKGKAQRFAADNHS